MDPSSFASTPFFGGEVRLHTYIRPLTATSINRCPGHDGLFARQLPIAFSCFSHLDALGFFRRRFDLFCHRSACLAIVVGVLLFTTQLIDL
jgi:hypothetical protein